MEPTADNTTRFSSRVQDYVKYRPSYPAEVAKLLSAQFDLPQNAIIVDIGSGTGLLTGVLLDELKEKNITVIGVEPNTEMRQAGDEFLSSYAKEGRFRSIDGTAEKMSLEDHSVNLIVAAAAFHWFDIPKARAECQRVLKNGSRSGVALLWNDRRGVQHESRERKAPEWRIENLDMPVMNAYDFLLIRNLDEYPPTAFNRTVDEASMNAFFGSEGFNMEVFPNPYKLDYDQVKGRLLSSSWTPQAGQEGYNDLMRELQGLFDKYQKEGKIDYLYETRVFYGPIS